MDTRRDLTSKSDPVPPPPMPQSRTRSPPLWWSNIVFFAGMHLVAAVVVPLKSPPRLVDTRTLVLCLASWQLATFGITVGYHRLWSHRSFEATAPLRCILALMGCLGFQGSIKWWILRHRLHHAFVDTDDDPYNANRGLLFSHMGWIFYRPTYNKMHLVNRKDLDADPVVRFQHKHYIALSLFLGLMLPAMIASLWNDTFNGFLWGGVVARLLIWHSTFLINSLAHWHGDQLYSRDVTARGNYLLAIFTGGEDYHHVFPKDYRNGPRSLDWDPTKWIIYVLHCATPWVPKIYFAPDDEIRAAQREVERLQHGDTATELDDEGYGSTGGVHEQGDVVVDKLPTWRHCELRHRVAQLPHKFPLVLIIDHYVVDATKFAESKQHPGGVGVLRKFAIPTKNQQDNDVLDATEAFEGGYNRHLGPAKRQMRNMRIARMLD